MTLDDLLKQNADFINKALKRRLFDKVDDKVANLPEDQRRRRMGELKARIADLSQRKEEAIAAYDRAIVQEKAELDKLAVQKPLTPTTDQDKPKPGPLEPKPVGGKSAKVK